MKTEMLSFAPVFFFFLGLFLSYLSLSLRSDWVRVNALAVCVGCFIVNEGYFVANKEGAFTEIGRSRG